MEQKICGIYKITSPSGKIYIGQSRNINKRILRYKNVDCRNQPKIYNSLVKYGWEAHRFEIIHYCSIEELNDLEKYYVDLFQTFNSEFGLNLKDGGGSKVRLSDETKQKISIVQKGRKLSEETKIKMSKSRMGRRVSAETREKIRIANTGKPSSCKGKHLSEEHRRKISIANKGKTPSYGGSGRIGRLNSKSKPIIQVDLNDNFIAEYENAEIAEKILKIHHVNCACNGKRRTAGGFKWIYAKDYYANNSVLTYTP